MRNFEEVFYHIPTIILCCLLYIKNTHLFCNIVVWLYLNKRILKIAQLIIINNNVISTMTSYLFANDVVFIILCLKVKAQVTIFPKIHLYLLRFIFASSTYDVIFVHATNNFFKSIYA